MTTFTPNHSLAYLSSGQAQKHVTVNENTRALDALLNLQLRSISTLSPPIAPADGDRYGVPNTASGVWTGQGGKVAAWQDGGWIYYSVPGGTEAWIINTNQRAVFTGSQEWVPIATVLPSGAATMLSVTEETLSLSGSYSETTMVIPARSIVFGVTTVTVTAVTGATSYDVGTASSVDLFGGSQSIAVGSSNVGIIGPAPYYSDTKLRITAKGGSFTGGVVRLALHTLHLRLPT